MRKTQDFETTTALAIALAIVPITHLVFSALAIALLALVIDQVTRKLQKKPKWLRYPAYAVTIFVWAMLLMPAVLTRHL